MVEYIEIEAKSVLQKQKYMVNWFWNRYGINPYRGCQFACNYCDALTEKYLVHKDYKDFSRIIYVKRNAPELLEKEVKKRKPDVVAMSGVTDPYQPAEKKYGLTRKILEILARQKFPVHIITKSDLVVRENFDVVNLLLQIAFFKEFKSANPYSAWAYHKASQTIEELDESITEICKRKALEKLPGVGKSISRVIEEFLSNAKSERLKKEINTW